MTVQLSLQDRIVLDSSLPVTQLSKMQIFNISSIKAKVSPSAVEIEEFKIVFHPNHVNWDEKVNEKLFSIDFTEIEEQEIVTLLRKMDKENNLTLGHKNLIKIFNI